MNTCETCKYHDSFSWVCFNPDSEHRADFTMNEDVCNEYADVCIDRTLVDNRDFNPSG